MIKKIFYLILLSCISLHAHKSVHKSEFIKKYIKALILKRHKHRHHCCCPPGPQGPQGQASANLGYAYIYSDQLQTLAPGDTVSYNNNGLMTSNIVHSTTTNPDQITIMQAGNYRIIVNCTSTGAMYFAIAINGVIQTYTRYGTNTGGVIQTGSSIISCDVGDIITIVNYSSATTTTLSNTSAGNPRISASLTFRQTSA